MDNTARELLLQAIDLLDLTYDPHADEGCPAATLTAEILSHLEKAEATPNHKTTQEVRDELADAFDLVADEAEDEGLLSPVEIGMASVFSDDDLRVEVRGILRRMAVTA